MSKNIPFVSVIIYQNLYIKQTLFLENMLCDCGHAKRIHNSEGCLENTKVNTVVCPCEKTYSPLDKGIKKKDLKRNFYYRKDNGLGVKFHESV